MSKQASNRWGRRRIIKQGGTLAGVGFLAGCLGNDEEEEEESTDDSDQDEEEGAANDSDQDRGGSERVDETLRVWRAGTEVIENLQWNPYNSATEGTGDHQAGGYIYDYLAFWAQNTGDVIPNILEDWSVDTSDGETTLDLEFRDDYYWHDGDQVTAHDWKTQIELDMEFTKATAPDERPHIFIEEFLEIDDHFAQIKLHDNLAEEFATIRAIGREQLIIKEDIGEDKTYGDWIEELRDSSGDEAEEIASEFSEWRQEDPIGTGPMEIVEMTDNSIVFEPFDQHPASHVDNINFSRIESIQTEDGVRAYLDGQVDALTTQTPVPEDLHNERPDEFAKFNNEWFHGIFIAFNQGGTEGTDPITADLNVRKAMMYIFDREVYEINTDVQYEMTDLPLCNITPNALDQYDFDLDDFTRYEPDEEQALSHLEEAGYTREDGQVVDSNGELAEVNVVTATGISDAFMTHAQTTSELLEQFGFDVTLEALDNAGFSERRFDGTYDIIPDQAGARGPVSDNDPSTWDDWYQRLYHLKDTYEIPMPVGDPDGSPEEVNVVELMNEWNRTGEDEDLRRIAWFHNQAVIRGRPIIGPHAGRLNTSGIWNFDNENRALTQVRPGMKNALRFDVEGARVYADE